MEGNCERSFPEMISEQKGMQMLWDTGYRELPIPPGKGCLYKIPSR